MFGRCLVVFALCVVCVTSSVLTSVPVCIQSYWSNILTKLHYLSFYSYVPLIYHHINNYNIVHLCTSNFTPITMPRIVLYYSSKLMMADSKLNSAPRIVVEDTVQAVQQVMRISTIVVCLLFTPAQNKSCCHWQAYKYNF